MFLCVLMFVTVEYSKLLNSISGMTAEDFLRPATDSVSSPYEKFRSELAGRLAVDLARVKVFSVMSAWSKVNDVIDVFFAIERPGPNSMRYGSTRSTYVSPVFLTAKIEQDRLVCSYFNNTFLNTE